MLTLETVINLDLPALAPYRTMRRMAEHRRQGWMVVEGEKNVERLLQSGWRVLSILATPAKIELLRKALLASPHAIQGYVASKELLRKIAGYDLYQGVLALAQLPPARALDAILMESRRPWLVIAVEGVSGPDNLGVIMRSCAALGATALVTGETCCSPFLRRTARVSMGAVFTLPIVESPSLCAVLHDLNARGVNCLAAHPQPGSLEAHHADLKTNVCVVLGAEGAGLSSKALALCRRRIAIPMRVGVDSLNVASACCVILYEAGRQRRIG